MSTPFRYQGVRSDQRQIAKDTYLLVNDQIEFLPSVTEEFFERTGLTPRRVRGGPLYVAEPKIGQFCGEEHVKPPSEEQLTPGRFAGIARHFVY